MMRMTEMKKMCSICRQVKPESDFRAQRRKKGDAILYRNSYCKECERWYMRMYMRQRREKSALLRRQPLGHSGN